VGDRDGEFKVVDKRHSATEVEETQRSKSASNPGSGSGFTMKDSPEEASPPYQIDFSTFIFSLATGAYIHLGLAPDPSTNQVQKDIPLAKQDIELLALLKDKTKGNLTTEEQKLFESLLTEVRLRFVEASKSKS
jgi:hypothetical protein